MIFDLRLQLLDLVFVYVIYVYSLFSVLRRVEYVFGKKGGGGEFWAAIWAFIVFGAMRKSLISSVKDKLILLLFIITQLTGV